MNLGIKVVRRCVFVRGQVCGLEEGVCGDWIWLGLLFSGFGCVLLVGRRILDY